jgi:hypothetical protein
MTEIVITKTALLQAQAVLCLNVLVVFYRGGVGLKGEKLHSLAVVAAFTGESLDELFRRECPHLFREIDRKLVPAAQHQEVQGDAESDDE